MIHADADAGRAGADDLFPRSSSSAASHIAGIPQVARVEAPAETGRKVRQSENRNWGQSRNKASCTLRRLGSDTLLRL